MVMREDKPLDDDLNIPTPPPSTKTARKFDFDRDTAKTVVVSLVVALVVFVGMGMFGGGTFVTKKNFASNMAEVAVTIDKAKTDMDKIKTDANTAVSKANSDVATAVQSIPATISNQVSGQINTSIGQLNNQLNTISSKVDTMSKAVDQTATNMDNVNKNIEKLQGQVTSLEQKVQDLEKSLGDYETRIKALETTTTTSSGGQEVDVDGELSVSLQTQFFDYVLHPMSSGQNEVQTPLRLTITNNSPNDVSDIRLSVVFQPQSYSAVNWASGYPKLVGGATTWQSYGYTSLGMYFVNGWGLSVKSGKSVTINLILYTKMATDLTTDYIWEPGVEVEDYQIK